MNIVLDACALIAALKGEEGGQTVDAFLADTSNICMLHAINACEIYYHVIRLAGEGRALQTIDRLRSAGVQIRDDLDSEIWQDAGRIRPALK